MVWRRELQPAQVSLNGCLHYHGGHGGKVGVNKREVEIDQVESREPPDLTRRVRQWKKINLLYVV